MSRKKKKDNSWLNVSINEPSIPVEKLDQEINRLIARNYPAYQNISQTIKDKSIDKFMILGLGDISTEMNARKQLSLILSLSHDLSIKILKFYDPISCEQSNAYLSSKGISIENENLHGQYQIEPNTAFFIFHGPHFLYHNLIISNLDPSKIKNLFWIGNSISELRTIKNAAKFIMLDALDCNLLRETKLDFNNDTAFENTYIIQANDDNMPSIEHPIWKRHDIYQKDNE